MAGYNWNPGFLRHSLGHTATKTKEFKGATFKLNPFKSVLCCIFSSLLLSKENNFVQNFKSEQELYLYFYLLREKITGNGLFKIRT